MSTCVGSFAIVVRDLVGGLGVVLGRWGGGGSGGGGGGPWWGVFFVIGFFGSFTWWCGVSKGFRLPLKWVCLPWFLMHLALAF